MLKQELLTVAKKKLQRKLAEAQNRFKGTTEATSLLAAQESPVSQSSQ